MRRRAVTYVVARCRTALRHFRCECTLSPSVAYIALKGLNGIWHVVVETVALQAYLFSHRFGLRRDENEWRRRTSQHWIYDTDQCGYSNNLLRRRSLLNNDFWVARKRNTWLSYFTQFIISWNRAVSTHKIKIRLADNEKNENTQPIQQTNEVSYKWSQIAGNTTGMSRIPADL